MKRPEASTTVSQAQSTVDDAEFKKNIIRGASSVLDRTFPLFNEMTRKTQIPFAFSLVFGIYAMLQTFSISMWFVKLAVIDYSTITGQIVRYIVMCTLFFDPSSFNSSTSSISIFFIVVLANFGLVIALGIFQLGYLSMKRTFINPVMYILRFSIEIMPSVLMIPMSFHLGYYILFSYSAHQSFDYLMVAFFFIADLIYCLLFSTITTLENHSPFISQSAFAAFMVNPIFIFVVSISFLGFFEVIFSIFQNWISIALAIVSIAIFVFIGIAAASRIFISNEMNVIMCSFAFGCACMTVLSIFQYFLTFADYAIMVTGAASIIGLLIAFSFVLPEYQKKASKKLSYEALAEKIFYGDDNRKPTEDEKNEYFEMLGIGKKNILNDFYMRIGIAYGSDLLIDWSLLRYSISAYTESSNLCNNLQLVAFFPGENRLMNTIFSSLVRRHDLSFSQRFFLFQVYRVKILRQSSSSNEVTEKLIELKQINSNCYANICSFWKNVPEDISVFWYIGEQLTAADSLWQEAIAEHPNSSRFCDEYSHFLVDCATDFEEGVRQSYKRNLIDAGRSFSVDLSFRSFIWHFPHYIRKKILDLRGNIVNHRSDKNGSNSQQNTSGSSSSELTKELDAEVEESVGKPLMNQHKIRLAYQRSISGRKSAFVSLMVWSVLFAIVVALACIVYFYIYLSSFFTQIQGIMAQMLNSNKVVFQNDLAFVAHVTQLSQYSGQYHTSAAFQNIISIDGNVSMIVDPNGNLDYQEVYYAILARKSMSSFYDDLSSDAQSGIDVTTVANVDLSDKVLYNVCEGNTKLPNQTNTSLQGLNDIRNMMLSRLGGMDPSQYIPSPLFCGVVTNFEIVENYSNEFKSSMLNYNHDWAISQSEAAALLAYIVPAVLWIVTSAPFLTFYGLAVYELRNVLKMMSRADTKSKETAQQTILKSENEVVETSTFDRQAKYLSKEITSIVFVLILNAIIPCILIIALVQARNSSLKFESITAWTIYGTPRNIHFAEGLIHIMNAIVVSSNVTYDDKQHEIDLAKNDFEQLLVDNNAVMMGTGSISSSLGFDSELDTITLQETCTPNSSDTVIHENYRCASLNQQLSYAYSLAMDLLSRLLNITDFSDQIYLNLYHLYNAHASAKISSAASRLNYLANIEISTMSSTLTICIIIAFCFAIFIVVGELLIAFSHGNAYKSSMTLMRRLPPLSIMINHELESYLLSRRSIQNRGEMPAGQSIIFNSKSPILLLGKSQIIEVINTTFTEIFGFTPEQLIGQPFSSVLSDPEKEKISHQLTLMRNGQAADIFEDHTVCVTDDNTELTTHITILGMRHLNEDVSSYVIVLRDESQLLKQQEQAESAKKKSEDLLYQILPRDIVTKLNQGEKDVSFTVNSATIMFIDIVRFSDYSATLTPEQIMGNLSLVFGAFDNLLAKYPMITKIKLIGDIYMCASGLFNPKDPPQAHADQMVKFALDCLTELEEINVKLDASLCVRIGVNSGGPIIAGVLGTDKPIFDIIGDPINVAARLQSTCVPGKIQIPQSTYDLIKDQNFSIEQRGEVFLKGKGSTMAFLISPASAIFSLKSTDNVPHIASA